MPIPFQITERLAGFVATSAKKGEMTSVVYRDLLSPSDAELTERLEKLHSCLFSKIPNLPDPSRIGQLIIVISTDLFANAYVDELQTIAIVKPNRAVAKGDPLFLGDIIDIDSVDLGIEVPPDAGIVVVRSFLWKRSLFFDFGPLHFDVGPRDYPLGKALAQQMLLLFGLPAPQPLFGGGQTRIEVMKKALVELENLLSRRCEDEAEYQILLERNPWMLGASYGALLRHVKMDDKNIPDFTALRAYDQCHDVVELKQPFLPLFRADGNFAASFNDSWNQAERYLDFCNRQRAYLLEQKDLRFENPRCLLLMGNDLSAAELRGIRTKEQMNRLITLITYDQLLEQGRHIFDLVATAGPRMPPDNVTM